MEWLQCLLVSLMESLDLEEHDSYLHIAPTTGIGGIFVLPYWRAEGPSFAAVENGTLSDFRWLAFKE